MELDYEFTTYDLKRLELYSQNMVDYHLIMDLIPSISKLFFLKKMSGFNLSAVQLVSPEHLGVPYLLSETPTF